MLDFSHVRGLIYCDPAEFDLILSRFADKKAVNHSLRSTRSRSMGPQEPRRCSSTVSFGSAMKPCSTSRIGVPASRKRLRLTDGSNDHSSRGTTTSSGAAAFGDWSLRARYPSASGRTRCLCRDRNYVQTPEVGGTDAEGRSDGRRCFLRIVTASAGTA